MLYKIAYVTLKLPLGSLDDLVAEEIEWLLEGKNEADKEHYEMVSYAFKVAYASVHSGKDIPLFDKEEKEPKEVPTAKKREEDLQKLEEIFGD